MILIGKLSLLFININIVLNYYYQFKKTKKYGYEC